MKREKPTLKGVLRMLKNGRLSVEGETVPYMNFYMEQISADDMKKLWLELEVGVKAASQHTISAMKVNGIMCKGGLRGDATVSITPNGFVFIFTSAKPEKASTTR